MPSFTIHNPQILSAGLVAPVSVCICGAAEESFRKSGATLPQPILTNAKIDTGADRSVIGKGLAAQLGLKPAGVCRVDTPSSKNFLCYEYAVRLVFSNDVVWQGIMLELPAAQESVEVLIGRDVLSNGALIYIGYDNSFSLCF
ncbi:MAG TPA: hypothetical protein VGP72_32695 [Planctomycetota bacterium]|jgi:hypothetical protein